MHGATVDKCKEIEISVLVRTTSTIKALKQASEMEHKLNACILVPILKPCIQHS